MKRLPKGRAMKNAGLQCWHSADACAVAAAKGAALMLREQQIVDEVEIILPASETARYRLHGQKIVGDTASCYVVGDGCDKHHVADGAEAHVSIKVDFFAPRRILLEGVPGADRESDAEEETPAHGKSSPPASKLLILEVVREVFAMRCMPTTLTVKVDMSGG